MMVLSLTVQRYDKDKAKYRQKEREEDRQTESNKKACPKSFSHKKNKQLHKYDQIKLY